MVEWQEFPIPEVVREKERKRVEPRPGGTRSTNKALAQACTAHEGTSVPKGNLQAPAESELSGVFTLPDSWKRENNEREGERERD